MVLRRVAGCVGFADVDGTPSSDVGMVSTLGSRPPLVGWCNILVSCLRILTCCCHWAAVSGSFPFSASRRSAAAATMRSPSEILGILQCAGKSRNVPVVSVPPEIHEAIVHGRRPNVPHIGCMWLPCCSVAGVLEGLSICVDGCKGCVVPITFPAVKRFVS